MFIKGWRKRICLVGSTLAVYSFMISSLANFSPSGTDGIGLNIYSPGNPHPISPRNIAGLVARSQKFPQSLKHRNTINWCVRQGYRAEGTGQPIVALASFPGSGNTWLRYLLQQATGLLTGSIYKDFALMKNGFPGESVTNGSVLVVKTHEYGSKAREHFDRAILLVREPFASLQAEFNRRSGGHIGHASADKYRRNNGKYWKNFVLSNAVEWRKMNLDWLRSFPQEDLHVVRYESLANNTEKELWKVLEFLQLDVSKTTMKCVLKRKDGIFKRKRKIMNFHVFNDDMIGLIEEQKDIITKELNQTIENNS